MLIRRGSCNCSRQLIPPYTPSTYEVSPARCNEHGDPSLPACSECEGKGNVWGKNRDDPPWWNCVRCGGSGVARNVA